jgi:hypothetical protein
MAFSRPKTTVSLIGLLLLVLAAPASAETRTASVQDAAEALPNLSGQPGNPDIRQVGVTYDTSGSLTFTIDFYNSVNNLDTSEYYAHVGRFAVGTRTQGVNDNYLACNRTALGGIWDGQHHVFGAYATFFDRASMWGYEGYLNFSRSISADGRRVTIRASHQALANRDYQCFEYFLDARKVSTASNPNSEYDASCGCWYTHGPQDYAGVPRGSDIFIPTLWFDGFAPFQAEARARTQLDFEAHGKCRAISLNDYRLRPRLVDGVRRPFDGRIIFKRFSGQTGRRQTRSFEAGENAVWKVKPGYHRVTARYSGDEWRSKSQREADWLTVRSC